jgi:peptidoglycan/LPS O-acetylase OafA/YrhL
MVALDATIHAFLDNPMTAPTHRANNFDTLRLLAALTVVLAHSIPLTYGPTSLDILWPLSRHQATFGYIAIQTFFIISGYLITASYLHSKSPARFIRARILRLAPALLAVLFLLAFGLGPLLTTLPLTAYFHSTLPYRAAFGLSDHLPGVFTNNPFSSGIDGSLWTLRYEALCYLAILLLGLCRLLRRAAVTPLFLILLAARLHFGQLAILDLPTLFFAGAVIQLWQPPLSARLAIPAAILWLASLFTAFYPLLSATAGAYLVIYIALAPSLKLPNLATNGDLSYGVYIFAWPIQQTITLLMGAHANWLINNLITLPLVLAFAWMSWHVIEAPALRLKTKNFSDIFARTRSAAPATK